MAMEPNKIPLSWAEDIRIIIQNAASKENAIAEILAYAETKEQQLGQAWAEQQAGGEKFSC